MNEATNNEQATGSPLGAGGLGLHRIKILHITQSVGGVETYLKQIISTIDHNRLS